MPCDMIVLCSTFDCCLRKPHGMGTTWTTFPCDLSPTYDAKTRN